MTISKEAIEAAEREFTEYFVRNYPGPDTIIFDLKWHAPKLFRAATRSLISSPGKDGGQEVEAVAVLGYVREAGLRSLAERNHTSIYPSPDEERGYTIPVYAQPASTALVERLGLAWAAVGHHEGIEISVHADAADTWNALCAILDPLALSALSASQSTSRERESR